MKQLQLSGTALKRMACVIMLIDHVSYFFLELGKDAFYLPFYYLSYLEYYTTDPVMQKVVIVNSILRGIGRLAFPLFAFLLVEGFLHTKNVSKYALRLACFAFITEPFFDFAEFGIWLETTDQNIYFTLTLGVLAMAAMRKIEQAALIADASEQTKVRIGYGALFVLIVCCANEHLLAVQYGMLGVLLIASLYTLRNFPVWWSYGFVLCTVNQFPATLALFPIKCYDGTRGNCKKWEQWAYYAFYPVHIAVIAVVAQVIL